MKKLGTKISLHTRVDNYMPPDLNFAESGSEQKIPFIPYYIAFKVNAGTTEKELEQILDNSKRAVINKLKDLRVLK